METAVTGGRFWAPFAWIDGQWRNDVVLTVSRNGLWDEIAADTLPIPPNTTVLTSPILPGLVNAHSHAFQRAFAGLSERRDSADDDFWSWRDRMYNVANRVTAPQMRMIAAQLYIELLKGGYTHVCEFQYLHRDESAKPYASPYQMAWELANAAADTGIGITILPALYERAGFDQTGVGHLQERFVSSPEFIYGLYKDVVNAKQKLVSAGIAIHSLRAASRPSIAELLRLVDSEDLPIHIHIAEQSKEVTDCIAATGARPIDYLCRDIANRTEPDRRWQLIHATHATHKEIESVASSGAGIVICPSTEANLGDGFVDLSDWLNAGVSIAIGSDSHVSRSWPEELRWLEYGQRLRSQKRNISASPQTREASSAARLFNAALNGGGAAAGMSTWGIKVGARADFLVINSQSASLLGVPPTFVLDAVVFSGNEPTVSEVYVAGTRVISNGRHGNETDVASKFTDVMNSLWSGLDSGR
jgi:formimidoylglutamate deiminase